MGLSETITNFTGFQWDEGNLLKNWEKHRVSAVECEQVFFNNPLLAVRDEQHSDSESRFYLLGQTDTGRKLFVVFTTRDNLIRVISARDMSRKERKIYEAL
ncbi:MAG: BrnT family toxin [Deltaproteobacteria bacterium]|jgi:uncharacterized DUF497 family protein|nr:MAG: BrnT family toxin [Deltaproteobacteria bacterium]